MKPIRLATLGIIAAGSMFGALAASAAPVTSPGVPQGCKLARDVQSICCWWAYGVQYCRWQATIQALLQAVLPTLPLPLQLLRGGARRGNDPAASADQCQTPGFAPGVCACREMRLLRRLVLHEARGAPAEHAVGVGGRGEDHARAAPRGDPSEAPARPRATVLRALARDATRFTSGADRIRPATLGRRASWLKLPPAELTLTFAVPEPSMPRLEAAALDTSMIRPLHERSPVVDPHDHRVAVAQILDQHLGAEWQRTMRRGHVRSGSSSRRSPCASAARTRMRGRPARPERVRG